MDRPDFSSAEISDSKLSDYLLSNTHPVGQAKAVFFLAAGFSADQPQGLADALQMHALQAPVVSSVVTNFGTKFIADGPMRTPGGRVTAVRSVWFLEASQTRVRFVTAYPARGSG